MLKVYLWPQPENIPADNGIGRVVHAQYTHLPAQGIEFVRDVKAADITAVHANKGPLNQLDVLHSHGMYWSGDPGSGQYTDYHLNANREIARTARRALAITVPSEWVGMVFKRDMRIAPAVIGHGIDLARWSMGDPADYVLWNKNRSGDVCDPRPPYELARRGVSVVSTFKPADMPDLASLMITGKLPDDRMAALIRGALVYLATTKETFGIGTLEAMACGVPVLGFNWGGTRDIVTHGLNGYLVKPYDYAALEEGYHYILNHRTEMSRAARATAEQYDWSQVMSQYAELYQQVYNLKQQERHGVSIVITNYNYGKYLSGAIDSALNQTRKADEIIVVDDGSTDNSREVLKAYQGKVKIITQSNQGVAAARSTGLEAASHPFVTLLDADDTIQPNFIAQLQPALAADRGLGIAYSGLTVIDDNGGKFNPDWPPSFSWESQASAHVPPSNCIPSACLFRREMWLRAGPHRQEYAPGEDAEFWTRGLSVGFEAQRVTEEKLFIYRAHAGSASKTKPWLPIDRGLPWLNDKKYPFAAPSNTAPLISSYSDPVVSVVIPVAVGHGKYLPAALDSLTGQTFRQWEVIVVLDGEKLSPYVTLRYPFVRWVTLDKPRGASYARNAGLKEVSAPLVLWLDADDILEPHALTELTKAHVESGGAYTYGDLVRVSNNGQREIMVAADYERKVWRDSGLHSVTALIPTEWLNAVGGFDEACTGWEEGDLFTRLAIEGYCGRRVPKVLLQYRTETGTQRKQSQAQAAALIKRIDRKYASYLNGEKNMAAKSCCGGGGDSILKAKQALAGVQSQIDVAVTVGGKVKMEYLGQNLGAITFFGYGGREYRGANNDLERYAAVEPADVPRLEHTSQWRRVVLAVPIDEMIPA